MRVLSWLTDHFYVKMPPKRDRAKKPKKGDSDSAVKLSPLKDTVTKRRTAVEKKKDIEKTTPEKTVKKPSKKKTTSASPSKVKSTPPKPTKPKTRTKITVKNLENDEQIVVDNLDILDNFKVTSPEKVTEAAKTPAVVSDVVGEPPAKAARNVMFAFTDDDKEKLFDWLEVEGLQQVTHKEYHMIPEEARALLQKKAAEFIHGKLACKGVQLYNMFKTNRKCYTTYTTVVTKSGEEAADALCVNHSKLQKHIIAVYKRHATQTGCLPVTRPRHSAKSKVSISCIILNISPTLFIPKFHQIFLVGEMFNYLA